MNLPEMNLNLRQTFQGLDSKLFEKYKDTIQNYQKLVIPFELKRINQSQNMRNKNITLQKQRKQLLKNIQRINFENQRQEYVMERQSQKINNLENKVAVLDKSNNDNLNTIQYMKVSSKQLEDFISQKSSTVKRTEEEKKKVLKAYEDKNNQYNVLLSNYMKDKNQIAEKLNFMNELQQNLFIKQKKLKQQEQYMKKQWEEFEQAKKQDKDKGEKPAHRIFKKSSSTKMQEKQQTEKPKYEKQQILTTPLKKIVKHHNNQIYDLSFNYNGSAFATCGGDRLIKVFDIPNLQVSCSFQTHNESIPLCLSLDYTGQKLLVGSTDKSVLLFSASTGKEIHSFVGHGYKINSVSWTSQKQKCVSGSQDKQIKIWDIEKVVNQFSISCGKAVKCINCNNTQPIIYSGHSDGSVRLYSLNQGASMISQIKGIIDYPINSIVVANNRNQLLVSSQQGSPIHLLDLKMNKSISKFEAKQFFNTLARADFSPSQKYILAGNCDGFIYYWNKEKQAFNKKISGHQTGITALKYHPVSNNLVSCDKQGSIIVWQNN